MITNKFINKTYLRPMSALLLAVLCVACGAKLIKGESPMVRISELSHGDGVMTVQLSIRNINDESLDILAIDLSLSSDEQPLLSYSGPANVDIIANGTEKWLIEIEESDASRDRLDVLQSGEIKSLPYLLEGSINTLDTGKLRFEYEGHLYPLPGRPGRFR